jgi:S-adenosylmethionine:tRNA ribosyltransferase-isomerase
MKTSDFDYELPSELIAQQPLPERSAARMLVVHADTGVLEHGGVRDLPRYLRAGDLLVLNDTRVIPARLFGRRADTGGRVELLLVEEVGGREWTALLRASGRPGVGTGLVLGGGRAEATLTGRNAGGKVTVRFSGTRPVLELAAEVGVPPVPPYIRRPKSGGDLVALDRERYQTVFAAAPGAVAAPTAGLHFDAELLQALENRGVERAAVTLHVGPGTFKPVKAERVEDHRLEGERYTVSPEAAAAISRARAGGGRIVAVGSTTVRTLETAASAGGQVMPGSGRTELFIRPPFEFKVVDLLLTNFHLPRSTLLMMVCAFAQWACGPVSAGAGGGQDLVLRAYREAIRLRYRFYSYGDCMLVLARKL